MRRITLLTNPDLCNLHCPLCFLNQRGYSVGSGEMPFEVAQKAVEKYAEEKDAWGTRVLCEVIPSTMGEPLLYSYFDRLLELCGSLHIPMNLTTNGSFPGKWSDSAGMERLIAACSDIKISTLSCETGGLDEVVWKSNVLRLLECRKRLLGAGTRGVALNAEGLSTVSLQVTLHRENLNRAESVLRWAENVGVHRIKWNPVVLLKDAPKALAERFSVTVAELKPLRHILRSDKIRCEGSLFFETAKKLCSVGGLCGSDCPFKDEVWIWPDGREDHCPNPERRFGQPCSTKSVNNCNL